MKRCQSCGTEYNPAGQDPRSEILCNECVEDHEAALDLEFQLEAEGYYRDCEGLDRADYKL